MKKIIAVIGARPQFIKHYPVALAAQGKVDLKVIHTGQHYNTQMSQIFFRELGMKKPDYMLEVGSGSHGFQTGRMMMDIEAVLLEEKPEGVIVYGDTNSTLAGALVAAKLHIPVFHIEAGVRSYNKEMPEEVNRVLTDHIANICFVPSPTATENLKKEGITHNVIEVGDVMRDLVGMSLNNRWIKELNIGEPFIYATIHRPYNTDDRSRLIQVLQMLNGLGQRAIFPVHPRTSNYMAAFNIMKEDYSNITFIEPQGYFKNLSYLYSSSALITDSGGMQKEAYWLKKKCITLRKETEWFETLGNGWNSLVFDDLLSVKGLLDKSHHAHVPLSSDQSVDSGQSAAPRIIEAIIQF